MPVLCVAVRIELFSLVDVAQLVESRIVIPVVVGSSPIVHPIPFRQFAPAVLVTR